MNKKVKYKIKTCPECSGRGKIAVCTNCKDGLLPHRKGDYGRQLCPVCSGSRRVQVKGLRGKHVE